MGAIRKQITNTTVTEDAEHCNAYYWKCLRCNIFSCRIDDVIFTHQPVGRASPYYPFAQTQQRACLSISNSLIVEDYSDFNDTIVADSAMLLYLMQANDLTEISKCLVSKHGCGFIIQGLRSTVVTNSEQKHRYDILENSSRCNELCHVKLPTYQYKKTSVLS